MVNHGRRQPGDRAGPGNGDNARLSCGVIESRDGSDAGTVVGEVDVVHAVRDTSGWNIESATLKGACRVDHNFGLMASQQSIEIIRNRATGDLQ